MKRIPRFHLTELSPPCKDEIMNATAAYTASDFFSASYLDTAARRNAAVYDAFFMNSYWWWYDMQSTVGGAIR